MQIAPGSFPGLETGAPGAVSPGVLALGAPSNRHGISPADAKDHLGQQEWRRGLATEVEIVADGVPSEVEDMEHSVGGNDRNCCRELL